MMTTQSASQQQSSIWADEEMAKFLRLRVKTFYNADYLERIILPLLNIPISGRVLDVGCGYGGLALLLAGSRGDLSITGVDQEASAVASASESAARDGLAQLVFEQGDAHRLRFVDGAFDAVLCQTVLTHVRDAEAVVHEMARVLAPGGVFMAAEYTNSGVWTAYDSVCGNHDEHWLREHYRLSRLVIQGKQALGRGDDSLGIRVPLLATAAGLDVFDMRLNDRVLHVIPPYRHPRQVDYLELLRAAYAPDSDQKELAYTIETLAAAGGIEADARWLYEAVDNAAVRRAIEDQTLTMLSSYMLYLTFARKPAVPNG